MSDRDKSDALRDLETRIEALKSGKTEKPHGEEHYSQAQMGWRMVTELVAGLVIGFGIGYGLDVLFGTLPILIVVFTLLGLAAGIKTMLRTAEDLQGGIKDGETPDANERARQDGD